MTSSAPGRCGSRRWHHPRSHRATPISVPPATGSPGPSRTSGPTITANCSSLLRSPSRSLSRTATALAAPTRCSTSRTPAWSTIPISRAPTTRCSSGYSAASTSRSSAYYRPPPAPRTERHRSEGKCGSPHGGESGNQPGDRARSPTPAPCRRAGNAAPWHLRHPASARGMPLPRRDRARRGTAGRPRPAVPERHGRSHCRGVGRCSAARCARSRTRHRAV